MVDPRAERRTEVRPRAAARRVDRRASKIAVKRASRDPLARPLAGSLAFPGQADTWTTRSLGHPACPHAHAHGRVDIRTRTSSLRRRSMTRCCRAYDRLLRVLSCSPPSTSALRVHSRSVLPPSIGVPGATRATRSALVVSHHLDGFLRAARRGLIASRCRPWGSWRFTVDLAIPDPSPRRTLEGALVGSRVASLRPLPSCQTTRRPVRPP